MTYHHGSGTLCTGDFDGEVKIWAVIYDFVAQKLTSELKYDLGRLSDGNILSICLTNNAKYLWIGDNLGALKQYSLEWGRVVKDFPKVHPGEITTIINVAIPSEMAPRVIIFYLSSNRVTFYSQLDSMA
jgi:hypothetical protein